MDDEIRADQAAGIAHDQAHQAVGRHARLMKVLTTIRVSRIRSLAECHRYGIAAAQMRWEGPMHVATWIGNCVHARIQGMQDDPVPDNLTFDKKTTTNIERARESVDKIMDAIGDFEKTVQARVPRSRGQGRSRRGAIRHETHGHD